MKKYVLLSLLAFNSLFPVSFLDSIQNNYSSYPELFSRHHLNLPTIAAWVAVGLAYWKAPLIADCFFGNATHTLTPEQESAIRTVLAKVDYTDNIRIRGVYHLENACVTPAGMYVDPCLIFDPTNHDQLSFEGEGIIGHEGIHARDNHLFKRFVAACLIPLATHAIFYPLYKHFEPKNSHYIIQLIFDRLYCSGTLYLGSLLAIQTVAKHHEIMADIRSAEILGPDHLISAFKKEAIKDGIFKPLSLFDKLKSMHPSSEDRINYLMKLKISKQNLENLTSTARTASTAESIAATTTLAASAAVSSA